MDTLTYSVREGVLTLNLAGYLDTNVTQAVNAQINEICDANPHTSVIIDAANLLYISSSGLRILLGVSKRENGNMQMINVSSKVYEVLEMTGFTKILNIDKALRHVTIAGCQQIGVGGVGTVYRLSPETIIKVFRLGTSLQEVQQEIKRAKTAFVLGVPTAISFETVIVSDASQDGRVAYGLIHELLNAKTVSSIIRENPDKAEEYGAQFGRLMREMHEIVVPDGQLPHSAETVRAAFKAISRYFKPEEIDILQEIYEAIPEGRNLLHCDLHPKNVMLSNDEMMLIDMGEICSGHPLQDLGHTYSSMVGLVGDFEGIIGMSQELSYRVWRSALSAYLGTTDEQLLNRREEQIRIVGLMRNFTWLSLSDSFPEQVVEECRAEMKKRVLDHLAYIHEMLPTLQEWA